MKHAFLPYRHLFVRLVGKHPVTCRPTDFVLVLGVRERRWCIPVPAAQRYDCHPGESAQLAVPRHKPSDCQRVAPISLGELVSACVYLCEDINDEASFTGRARPSLWLSSQLMIDVLNLVACSRCPATTTLMTTPPTRLCSARVVSKAHVVTTKAPISSLRPCLRFVCKHVCCHGWDWLGLFDRELWRRQLFSILGDLCVLALALGIGLPRRVLLRHQN